MNSMILLRVAGPMIGISILLLAIGILAAYNVHEQQQANSDLIAREVNGMFAVEKMFIAVREIRREIDLYLRNGDEKHLGNVTQFLKDADAFIEEARLAARTPKEFELIGKVDEGYHEFESQFLDYTSSAAKQDNVVVLEQLNDQQLSAKVIEPIKECIDYNHQVVALTAANAKVASQHLRLGFLLLGISGCIAGMLFGLGVARTLSRYIVQLDVSIRGVAGKLHDQPRAVQISHLGDLEGLEFSVKRLEDDMERFVERLQARELELLRSEQMAIIGQLAAGMAHEIRNPLMPIKVLVQAALERGPDHGLHGDSLIIVNEEITRLERSVQAFLDFARPPALQTTKADMVDLLSRCVNLVQSQAAQRQIQITSNFPVGPIHTRMDVGQIHQVILNLLLNAMDAMPSGGVIEIEVHAHASSPEPSEYISGESFTEHDAMRLLQAPANQEWFAIYIRDNGPGFSSENLGKAFEPFFTTKETGTGLGLAISKRIILSHGGRILLRNRPEGGAEFTLLLPHCLG